jgi:hypothetical protein
MFEDSTLQLFGSAFEAVFQNLVAWCWEQFSSAPNAFKPVEVMMGDNIYIFTSRASFDSFIARTYRDQSSSSITRPGIPVNARHLQLRDLSKAIFA